jgi:hypothetical protein
MKYSSLAKFIFRQLCEVKTTIFIYRYGNQSREIKYLPKSNTGSLALKCVVLILCYTAPLYSQI